MAIIRFGDRPFFRNPWADFERMRRELDTMFEGVAQDLSGRFAPTVFPALNISEDSSTIYIRAEIPGVPAADLDISIEGDTLTIKGERGSCGKDEAQGSYHRRELDCGSFSRAVTLPTRINVDKVAANSQDGILTIILPKADEVKPRQISINAG